MIRTRWVRRGLLAALVALPLPFACTNNPFNPRAELVVTLVQPAQDATSTSTAFAGQIGIAQDMSTGSPVWVFADPQVTIKSGPKQPDAYIDTALINVTLGTTQLPTKKFPVVIYVPKDGSYTGVVPFLRGDPDVRNVVFPNGTTTKGQQGVAKVTLMGKDKNGNEVSCDFTAALSFATFNTPVASASPSALPVSPSGTPTAVPTAAPTPAPAVTPPTIGG